jgi:hypothetical protein
MLTNTDYLQLILKDPEVTFFYHDQPILYTNTHKDKTYMVFLVDTDNLTDRFLVVEYAEVTYDLLNAKEVSLREFVIHANNTVHSVLIEYPQNDEPRILHAEPYEDNSTIPDEDLPTKDALWNSNF